MFVSLRRRPASWAQSSHHSCRQRSHENPDRRRRTQDGRLPEAGPHRSRFPRRSGPRRGRRPASGPDRRLRPGGAGRGPADPGRLGHPADPAPRRPRSAGALPHRPRPGGGPCARPGAGRRRLPREALRLLRTAGPGAHPAAAGQGQGGGGAEGGRPGTGPAAPPRDAGRPTGGPHRQGVRPAGAAAAPPRRSAAAFPDRLPGVGHEFRQRHQRHRSGGTAPARQGGRALRAQADPHRAGHGLCAGRAGEAHFDELDQHELAGKLRLIGNLLEHTDTPLALEELPQRLDEAFVGHDMAVLLRDGEGSVIYALQAGEFPPARIEGQPLAGGVGAWERDGRRYIGREAAFAPPPAAGARARPLRVLLAVDVSHHVRFLEALRQRLWAGISASAGGAALLGWFVAHRGLAPLRRVTATAHRLSAERLGERLAEDAAPAEVRDLVEAFNGMLDRLEDAFQRLKEFSADIAHELRTPVSNLMTQTEVALSRSRSAEDYREVLASNLEEYERIARMVSDMLFLAQADKGRLPRAMETVALAEEARALADFYEALADEQGVALTVSGEASVKGDRLMLRRAVSNLLSNALRHTPRGGRVAIKIAHDSDDATLAVTNPGEPIPAEELPRIFERFHRAGTDRRRQGEGAGLGLAIEIGRA